MKRFVMLLVAALFVAGGIVLHPWQAEQHPPEPKVWPEISASKASIIEIANGSGEFSLVRKAGNWYVDIPHTSLTPLASTDRVEHLVNFINNNEPIRRIWDDPDLEQWFQATASIVIDGAERIELGLGDETGKGVYARREGEWGAFVLAGEYVELLERPVSHYLDFNLTNFKAEDVVTVAHAGLDDNSWTVEKAKDGYAFTAPEAMTSAQVKQEELGLWLHVAEMLKASALADQGQNATPTHSFLFDTGKAQLTVELYAPQEQDKHWVVRSSLQDMYFLLDPGLADKLNRNAFSLVERRMLASDAGPFQQLHIASGERSFFAKREKDGWKQENSSTFMTGIDMFLWRLTDLQYEYGPVGALPASATEEMRLFLKDRKGSLLGVVFFEDTGLPTGRIWAAIEGKQAFYPVDGSLYRDLQGLLPAPKEPVQE